MTGESRTYDAAGVSLAKAEEIVERLRGAVESTGTVGFGAFAGLYPLDERRLLAASTDSVGSKLILSRRAGRLHWAGMDLAAHCINDVITTGADRSSSSTTLLRATSTSNRWQSSSRAPPRSAARRAAC